MSAKIESSKAGCLSSEESINTRVRFSFTRSIHYQVRKVAFLFRKVALRKARQRLAFVRNVIKKLGPNFVSAALPALILLLSLAAIEARQQTVLFSVTAPGVGAAITNWGVDTGAATSDDVRRGLIFMGTNTVNLVQVAFEMNAPATNHGLTPGQGVDLTNMINLASMTSTNARWIMSSGTGAGVDPSYQSGAGTVYPNLWAAEMEVWQRAYSAQLTNRSMFMTQPFNEPDYGWGQGSQQNLYDIMGYLQASTNFAGVHLAGGTTLDCDLALSWYDAIASRASIATTHCLAGGVSSYVNFIQTVLADKATPFDPEMHNLGEANDRRKLWASGRHLVADRRAGARQFCQYVSGTTTWVCR